MCNLKLVINNENKRTFWHFIFQKRKSKNYHEKRKAILDYLTLKFAQFQTTTGKTNFFPLNEAIFEVEKLEQKGMIEKYYRIIKKRCEKNL